MLERFLTENLAKHFGEFVEGLDSDQVRLSAWKGEIHLQNLQVKRHALDSLFQSRQAPVEIAYGKVGNLQISIPWTVVRNQLTWRSSRRRLLSEAAQVSIVLTDVSLLVTPRRDEDANEKNEPPQPTEKLQEQTSAREEEIQAALDAELLRRVAESSADIRTEGEKKSWIQNRLAALLENLSVTIRNIHIRYEDTGHAMGFSWTTDVSRALAGLPMQRKRATPIHRYRPTFCVGITLKEFSILAIDPSSEEEETNKKESSATRTRVASAQELAIYWDSDTPIMSETAVQEINLGPQYYENAFETLQSGDRSRGWSPKGGFAPIHSFVLDPFSPSITLLLAQQQPNNNTAAVSTTATPETLPPPSTLRGHLPPCRFALSRNLLEDLGYLRNSYAIWKQSTANHLSEETLRRVAGLRPKKSPLKDPRGWWHYVMEAVTALNREEAQKSAATSGPKSKRIRLGWLGVARLLSIRKKYLASYEDLIQTSSNEERSSLHQRLVELENELDLREVIAFRIHAYSWLRDRNMLKILANLTDETKHKGLGRWGWGGQMPRSSNIVEAEATNIVPASSSAHEISDTGRGVVDRIRSFYEMGQALDREQSNMTTREQEDHELDQQDLPYGLDNRMNPVTWKADLSCGEISLQVNDRRVVHRHRDKPAQVIRLSCAFKQEQRIYQDGSWVYELRVGSLKVKDCTHRRSKGSNPRSFPYLIGPKRGYVFKCHETFSIDGKAYDQIVRLEITRSQHAYRSSALGSTTSSVVQVLPLEICYLTSPVEALSRILNTANIDFADDYQRLSSSIYSWRERQKKRLLAALSQQNKQILVNIDLWAPTIQMPEGDENNSPVLLVDLGHLAFSNDDNRHTHVSSMADHWRLSLSEIQVQCSTVGNVAGRLAKKSQPYQQVVEPFSLNLAVSTSFHRNETESFGSVQDKILVVATLPRLVFDLNASVVRLLRRLQSQWNQRKHELQTSLLLPTRAFGGLAGREHRAPAPSAKSGQASRGNRIFQFRFVAPLLRLKFDNDVDGRDCHVIDDNEETKTTPIIDLCLRGIEGEVENERLENGMVRHCFQAKLKSVDAKDLYQQGGSQFCWLLSSISPDTLQSVLDEREAPSSVTDLVSFRYTSSEHAGATGKEAESDHGSNRLAIRFHELFVEWNPDTIAAINYAIRASDDLTITNNPTSDADDDLFFDAEEDEFLEVGSIESDESESPNISEISSRPSSYSDLLEFQVHAPSNLPPGSVMFSPSRQFLGGWGQFNAVSSQPALKKTKRMEVEFELSKLRINFNKETRHRRVFIAEVDQTSIAFVTRPGGGYRSNISLGNLTLADPQSDFDGTLYREILGLKGDTIKSAGENSSLLEMTTVKNPRARRFTSSEDWTNSVESKATDEHVSVDLSRGIVRGCDMYLSANLSPMRFVYLQQLWFEIVDYMFEGVLGFEVWGNTRPSRDAIGSILSDQAQAEAVTFTLFSISMQSPIILFPVTFCSTNFIKLETDSIEISNFYSYQPVRQDGAGTSSDVQQLQWFNNCMVKMNQITLSSWMGHMLNSVHDTVNCEICLNWPTGPLAPRNKPKWKVSCTFDELRLSLPKEDYALLQHIISSNLSEPSRHLDEWNQLQGLPIEVREAFERDSFVAFGYDKKDVTPSTFDVTLSIPLLLFALRDSKEGQIAVAQCKDVVWTYMKFADLVSRQRVECDLSLVGRDRDAERIMLSSHELWSAGGRDVQLPKLIYKSTTTPIGDNDKELSIDGGCIHVGYKPWIRFADFFSKLPAPSFLSPHSVIQVGDRWYKISDGGSEQIPKRAGPSLEWIKELGSSSSESPAPVGSRREPMFSFDLQLRQPRIALKAEDSALTLVMECIHLNHRGHSGFIQRQVDFMGVELQTMSQNASTIKQGGSLISPLDIKVEMRRCNGAKPCRCSNHSTSVDIQRVMASAAFTDLVRVALVSMLLKRDVNEVSATSRMTLQRQESQPSSETSGVADSTLSINCDGLRISLIDDSGRHFADTQEMLRLTMQRMTYLFSARSILHSPGEVVKSTIFAVQDLCVRDSLQSDVSPFQSVLAVQDLGDAHESCLSAAEQSSLKLVNNEIQRCIEISQVVAKGSTRYMLGVHAVQMQYNPSMIVALQRFLGRLFKTINRKVKQPSGGTVSSSIRPEETQSKKSKKQAIEAVVVLKQATISLNKEHQGRCLLDVKLADVHITAKQTEDMALLNGMVGFFSAMDANNYDVANGIKQDNRPIVKMRKDKDRFLQFEYKSFRKKLLAEDFDSSGLPTWVLNHSVDVDDYLDLSVASVEIVYLSPRTSELIDYLSNGLPGKGMGATSRAAKGFVVERIQKKSFLQINVDAPLVLVPMNEYETTGLAFGGEVRAKSWIEVSDATRKLSLSVGRLYAGVYVGRFQHTRKPMMSNVDVSLDVSRDVSDNTSVSCNLSNLFARLSYSDYVAAICVMRENVVKKIDKSKWDNVEAAWEHEAISEVSSFAGESPRGPFVVPSFSMDVIYSTDARYIRYGQGRRRESSRRASRLDVTLDLGDLSLVLHRDDPSGGQDIQAYDMMLFRAQGFEASFSSVEDGSSASLSIHRVFLFDTGTRGRQVVSKISPPDLSDNLVVVLVEGYAPPQINDKRSNDKTNSQLIIRVDKSNALGSAEYRMSLVLNHLSVAVLVPPIQDLMAFLWLEWPTARACEGEVLEMRTKDETAGEVVHTQTLTTEALQSDERRYHLQVVLHYPQFIFAATDGDSHSRALVLRGLAILKGFKSMDRSHPSGNSLKINSDFQNVSSHIVPDSSEILCIAKRHYDLVTECLPEYAGVYHQDGRLSTAEKVDKLGVALLLPVTVGVEFEQTESFQAEVGVKKSLGFNMDPLSVMLSADDLLLIRSLAARWASPKPSKRHATDNSLRHFEIVFETERLGLGLRRESGNIVVDAAHASSDVCIGDILYSINGAVVAQSAGLPLTAIVERLREEPRPLRIGFVRKVDMGGGSQSEKLSGTLPSKIAVTTSADFSFSEATITLIDEDVSLVKGKVSSTRITYNRKESDNLVQKISFRSTLSVDYYNLRIWHWEPLLEPGSVYTSAEYTDPRLGPKSLALEMGDRGDVPLCFNLTDAGASILSKFRTWANLADDPSIERVAFYDQAGQAANVALQFAKRQKHAGGMPFVFENRCGISCAFAVQRKNQDPRIRRGENLSLLGEYCGLQLYSKEEVYVVAPNSEYRFRVHRPSNARRGDAQGLRPCLTVAFQSIVGLTLEPLCDLQMVKPGESLVALSYRAAGEESDGIVSTVWLSWKVEVTDERTILTLGSAFRITSQLRATPVEIGVELDNDKIESLGLTPENSDFHVPVWLSLKRQFRLHAKPEGQFEFAPISEFITGTPSAEVAQETKYIECMSIRPDYSSIWLASRIIRKGLVVTVTIDCCLMLLNLLPISLQWEVSIVTDKYRRIIDGSTQRDGPLHVGKFAEILGSQNGSLFLRLKSQEWSNWVPLAPSAKGQDSQFQNIALKDQFGVPLVVGLRATRQTSVGIQVTFFAETWFMNATTLNLSFGAPSHFVFPRDNFHAASSGFEEISTAEAALKEFSALFETGEGAKNINREKKNDAKDTDICLLPFHSGTVVLEECYEYIEVESSVVKKRWWGTENPKSSKPNLTCIKEGGDGWRWLDTEWLLDNSKNTPDAWESAAKLREFSRKGIFIPSHKFRRRRWYRRRKCEPGLVTAFSQGISRSIRSKVDDRKSELSSDLQFALRIEGGRWALTSRLPTQGTVYGAIRADSKPIGTRAEEKGDSTEVYELCYSLQPMEGEWGELSRLMTVSSRFMVRNDSSVFTFEVKQVGCPDGTARLIPPGGSIPFHWSDLRLPALLCVRPLIPDVGTACHKWTGGFDPLSIGVIPVRIRETAGMGNAQVAAQNVFPRLHSLKVEAAIRPKSGGTGINISFKEEDEGGQGCLFRIDNCTPFPVWFAQDGLLANPSSIAGWNADGDILSPSQRMPFSLDVPFRQGKYSHRQAASIEELLRVRLSLAPLNSRVGIEATRVVSFALVGGTVKLNPAKIPILNRSTRMALELLRVIGVVTNDGPTRVLNLVLMRKEENLFPNPFREEMSPGPPGVSSEMGSHAANIIEAAENAVRIVREFGTSVPTQEVAVKSASVISSSSSRSTIGASQPHERQVTVMESDEPSPDDLIISLRVSFGGFTFSLVDSAPSEIATITLRNVNAIASWNTRRTTDSTIYFTISHYQVDNMVPNAPYPVAIVPLDYLRAFEREGETSQQETSAPLLVIGISLAPRHQSGVEVVRSVTVAPKSLAIRVDLAFLVRLQKYVLDLHQHFAKTSKDKVDDIILPNLRAKVAEIKLAARSGENSQMFYFGGLTILPCAIQLSVAPARALTNIQAGLEGAEAAAIHRAVRKGDLKLGDDEALLGVKIGHRNDTPLAVMRGVFKSIVVDALLRLDGASLNFSGVSLKNHVATGPQLTSYLAAHYMESLRKNVPALVGSLAALGNPVGLVRGLGDGVSDFVLEPVKGFQRSLQENDMSFLVDGVARGTLSLARHTVGGFANSAAALTETFSKNMTVLTLDRRYAQKRDRGEDLRTHQGDMNVALGLGSGVQKLVHGFLEGVTGVVKAPIRGAEKRGLEGFAKGVGKGLLGLFVKPLIGVSDGLTDVMIGVKGSVEGASGGHGMVPQIRPRRPVYGRDRAIRPYSMADAAAVALMQRTRLAGELYMSHLDMGDRLALLSVKRLLLMGPLGEELLVLKYKHIERAELQGIFLADGSPGWGIILVLNTPRRNGSEVEVINCREQLQATTLLSLIDEGTRVSEMTSVNETADLASTDS